MCLYLSGDDDKPSLPPKASSDSIQRVNQFVESHKSKVSNDLDSRIPWTTVTVPPIFNVFFTVRLSSRFEIVIIKGLGVPQLSLHYLVKYSAPFYTNSSQ